MIFYRSSKTDAANIPMRVRRVRYLSLLAMAAYPLGCVTNLYFSMKENVFGEMFGYVLIFGALICAGIVVMTGVQRIIGDEIKGLDPIELELRRGAYAKAYHIATAIMLLGLVYLGMAFDTGKIKLWVPSDFDHWNAIIWGGALIATLLPTAILAWSLPLEEVDDDGPLQV